MILLLLYYDLYNTVTLYFIHFIIVCLYVAMCLYSQHPVLSELEWRRVSTT